MCKPARCHPLSEIYGLAHILLTEPTNLHYIVKQLKQNLTNSFKVMGKFLIEKNTKTALEVKRRSQM